MPPAAKTPSATRSRSLPSEASAGPAATSSAAQVKPDDSALLLRLRKRDRAAFAKLSQRHAGALLRFARTLVRGGPSAEELVQDTWVAALDGLAKFEGRATLRTWLLQILLNKARTRFARERRTVPLSSLSGDEGEPAFDPDRFDRGGAWKDPPSSWSEDNPERLVQGAEAREAIEAAIADLPEAQRAVITLRDMEGLEVDEICNLLSITVTNQRVLLHRARTKVRRALERHLGRAG